VMRTSYVHGGGGDGGRGVAGSPSRLQAEAERLLSMNSSSSNPTEEGGRPGLSDMMTARPRKRSFRMRLVRHTERPASAAGGNNTVWAQAPRRLRRPHQSRGVGQKLQQISATVPGDE
jgi:hypothetical protein